MKLIYLSLFTALTLGCQGPQSAEELSKSQTSANAATSSALSSSTNESDSSEGVVGPDEAFFAGVYLDSVFAASKSNPHPTLEAAGTALKGSATVEAFDFAANLQPKRLDLMSRILLKQGDKDGDGSLNYEEFSALKVSADLKGLGGADLTHAFDKETFDAAAGADALLSAAEIQDLLGELAGESDLSKLSKAEARKALVKSWEAVLKLYDADGDGKLSLDEQTKLRKDRALILSRFAAE